MAIITLADLQAFGGGAISTYTLAQLNKAVDAVNLLLPRYCHRTFDYAVYYSWIRGTGGRLLPVPNYPIANVHQATYVTDLAMAVECVSATGSFAYGSLNNNTHTLLLALQGGVDAFAGPALDLTAIADMAALDVAVTALSPTLITTPMVEGLPVAVKPFGAVPLLSPNVLYLELPSGTEECSFSDRVLEKSMGSWPKSTSYVYVQYEGGYTTMPDDLQTLACRIAIDLLALSQLNPVLSSERLGDWSWTAGSDIQSLLGKYKEELDSWRRILPC